MPGPTVTRGVLGALFGALLSACVPGVTSIGGIARADAPPVPFPDCAAQVYEFAGESTFNALELVDALPAEPPTPDRPAMIWVTRDRLPLDIGPAGGAIERTRMMCFEFPDGSGGSQWPVDDSWQLPTATSDSGNVDLSLAWLLVPGALLLLGASALAFRRRG